jgi:hypothetical protein
MIQNYSKKLRILNYRSFKGAIKIETQDTVVYNVYLSPNTCSLPDFEGQLLDIQMDMAGITQKLVIIAGDFNAKHPAWGGNKSNKKGTCLLEWITTMGLNILNEGDKPTCIRSNGSSHIDMTLANTKAAQKATWEVLDDESMSDHCFILTCLEERRCNGHQQNKYIFGITNFDTLNTTFRQNLGSPDAKNCEKAIKNAYIKSTPKIRGESEGKLPYWWTEEIQRCIQLVRKARKRAQRNKNNERGEMMLNTYKNQRLILKKSIAAAKNHSWDELCKKLEKDPFGDAYQIVKSHMKAPNPKISITVDEKIKAFESLFIGPQSAETCRYHTYDDFPEELNFSEEEVKQAAKRIKPRKSPGPDGIPPEIIKELILGNATHFAQMFSGVLRKAAFPTDWKLAKLILLEKPKKSPNEAPKYRPICLINVLAKTFESLINERLMKELETNKGISDFQFGFRRGRSTVDAVNRVIKIAEAAKRNKKGNVLILIDVKNAFNSASWKKIMEKLEKLKISKYLTNVIADYLNERHILLERDTYRKIGGGVPQGSVLGPTLWNVLYDEVMRMELPDGVELTCYADDLAISVTASTPAELMAISNAALYRVNLWMKRHNLEIAPQKTVAIPLSGDKKMQNIKLKIEDTEIAPSQEATYLGVVLDRRLSYNAHIRYSAVKAHKTINALSSIMRNTKGPGQGKRKVLALAMESILLYAAPVWAKAMERKAICRSMLRVQRIIALRVCMAYRTVSLEASQVLSGLVPIDLLAKERERLYKNYNSEITEEIKLKERQASLREWQRRWDEANSGRWTYQLIRNIEPWIGRKHGEVTFRMVQCMTGHGVFGKFLKRINKVDTEGCNYCASEKDDAEHTVFWCTEWAQERERLKLTLELHETLTPENLVSYLLKNESNWNAIRRFMESIMQKKEMDERARQ